LGRELEESLNQLASIGRELLDVDYLSASAWDESAHDRMRRLRIDAPLYWAPSEDLISALVAADDAGVLGKLDLESVGGSAGISEDALELAADELVMVLVTLMVAGNETTRNALSGAVERLIRNPEIRDRLVANPELIPDAVEDFCASYHPFMPLREILRRLPDMQFSEAGPIVEPHALVCSCTRMDVSFTKEFHQEK